MRNKESLIDQLFRLWVDLKWDDMEEYFAAAYALAIHNGAKFKLLEDIIEARKEEVRNGMIDDRGYIGFYGNYRRKMKEAFEDACDKDDELNRLGKYDDSEEGWREEVNAGPESLNYFRTICNKFITFKS